MAQIVKTETDEIVILSRREYDALMARLGDEEAEDRMSLRLVSEAAGLERLPAWLAEKMMEGLSPITAARRHAGLTQVEAAARADMAQSYYSAIESGTKRGSLTAIGKIAKALDVNPAWLQEIAEEPVRASRRRG